MPVVAIVLVGVAAAAATLLVLRAAGRRLASEVLIAARTAAAGERESARIEAASARRHAVTAAREEALERRAAVDAEALAIERKIVGRDESIARGRAAIATSVDEFEARARELEERDRAVQSLRDRAGGLEHDTQRRGGELRTQIENRAGTTGSAIKSELIARWVEQSRAAAAQRVRTVEQSAADPSYDREAQRVLGIAVGRYHGHFLTERNQSNLKVGSEVCELLQSDGGSIHAALSEVANIQILINDAADAVRLEGIDGVGREVARRALHKLFKKQGTLSEIKADPTGWASKIRAHLDQEIRDLGRKAFRTLEIPRAHPDIVELVGALNYRTSYTQNQWLHAVEAAFLCGMMADELGLDVKLARRATLIHDIGKALTHKIDGSHAVIGADIARKLGESEIVANAIGAHHADEPCNSVYAYLVAAADAMSGARPGARREQTEGFSGRVDDLERIGGGYRGVHHAHAVHGGRELRIYVRENEVDDLRVVELSSEIAAQIAEEMTFPGQIKVTVIRAFEAVATAS